MKSKCIKDLKRQSEFISTASSDSNDHRKQVRERSSPRTHANIRKNVPNEYCKILQAELFGQLCRADRSAVYGRKAMEVLESGRVSGYSHP